MAVPVQPLSYLLLATQELPLSMPAYELGCRMVVVDTLGWLYHLPPRLKMPRRMAGGGDLTPTSQRSAE